MHPRSPTEPFSSKEWSGESRQASTRFVLEALDIVICRSFAVSMSAVAMSAYLRSFKFAQTMNSGRLSSPGHRHKTFLPLDGIIFAGAWPPPPRPPDS